MIASRSVSAVITNNQVFVALQGMEIKNADWSKLFELNQFFDTYKNYLQIDVTAADDDDLRKWKGWVESRLRQLTLKVKSNYEILTDSTFSPFYVYVHVSST